MLEAREKSANLEYEIFMRIREEVGKLYPALARPWRKRWQLAAELCCGGRAAGAPRLLRSIKCAGRKRSACCCGKVMGAQGYIPNILFGPGNGHPADYWSDMSEIDICASLYHHYGTDGILCALSLLPVCRYSMRFTRIGAAVIWYLASPPYGGMMEAIGTIRRSGDVRSFSLLSWAVEDGDDGMALAQAIIEHIHQHYRTGAKTLFATHYHELTALEWQGFGKMSMWQPCLKADK